MPKESICSCGHPYADSAGPLCLHVPCPCRNHAPDGKVRLLPGIGFRVGSGQMSVAHEPDGDVVATILFTPDMSRTEEYCLIELDYDQCRALWCWLGELPAE